MSAATTMRIAHISDPHFGTEVVPVRDALLRELHDAPPDVVVLSGDVTQRARRAQFRKAAAFLRELPAVPRVCLPGNHDIPLFDVFTRLVRPYARFRKHVSTELAPQFLGEQVAVVGVDATSPRRHKDGALPPDLIDDAAARLSALPQPFRVVVTHQPLASATRTDRTNVAHGAAAALERWIPAGADLFLGGHIHLPYCLQMQTADARHSGVLLQAGTCISHRTRDGIPNSYNVIRLERDAQERRMLIERRDYDAQARAFAPRLRHVARSATRADWQLITEES